MKNIFRLLLILFLAWSCKEVYDRPPQSLAQVNLYRMDTKKARSTRTNIVGLNQDSTWISNQNLSQFRLPFDQSGEAIFVLLLDSIADTLTIRYSSKLVYESMESGFYTEHAIQSIDNSWNKIDSISVIDTVVISNWHENIQLYLNDSSALGSSN